MLPLGSLLVGYLSPITGAPLTIFAQGIIAIIIGTAFYKKLINSSIHLKQSNNGKLHNSTPGNGYANGNPGQVATAGSRNNKESS
jgi:hypothetical protein